MTAPRKPTLDELAMLAKESCHSMSKTLIYEAIDALLAAAKEAADDAWKMGCLTQYGNIDVAAKAAKLATRDERHRCAEMLREMCEQKRRVFTGTNQPEGERLSIEVLLQLADAMEAPDGE